MSNNYGPTPRSMDFGESIGTCLRKYFVFDGRASKSEFWYFFLVYTVGNALLSVIAETTKSPLLLILSAIVTFGTIIPMISVGCRRMHDINQSGWWQLIPLYNLYLWVQDASEGISKKQSTNYKYEATQNTNDKNDITDELEELEELYKDGTLSEAQFKKAKKKLLK